MSFLALRIGRGSFLTERLVKRGMQVSYAPFALLSIPNVSVCLVFWLNYYIAACGTLGVPLLSEKLFRSSAHKKFVSHRPLEVQPYMQDSKSILRLPALMTERPFTLKGLGCTPEQIAQYVVWRSTEIASYYTRRSSASTSLQLIERVTLNLTSAGSPPALQLSDQENSQRISYS